MSDAEVGALVDVLKVQLENRPRELRRVAPRGATTFAGGGRVAGESTRLAEGFAATYSGARHRLPACLPIRESESQ